MNALLNFWKRISNNNLNENVEPAKRLYQQKLLADLFSFDDIINKP